MATDWDWKDVGFTVKEAHFHTQKGACNMAVWLDSESGLWSAEASIASPDEDEVDGVRLSCNKTFSTKEQAQAAIIKLLKRFVKKLYADVGL